MLVSLHEPPSEHDLYFGGVERKPLCIPVRWQAVGFKCKIKILAGSPGDATSERGPVRLRVREAVADCCRLEIFCGEAGLSGVSAGY